MEIPRRTDFTIYIDQVFNVDRVIIDSEIDYLWDYYIIHAKYLKTSGINEEGKFDYYRYICYKDSKATTLKTPYFSCEIRTPESFIGEELQYRWLHYPIYYYNRNVFRLSFTERPISKSFRVRLKEKYNNYNIEIIGNVFTLLELLKKIGTDSFETFYLKENINYIKEILSELDQGNNIYLEDYLNLYSVFACHVIKPIRQEAYYFSSIQERKKVLSEAENIKNRVNALFIKVSQ
jgi:hypothetical protein